MRMQYDAQVQVAVATAVETFAPFARNAQLLPVRCTARDANLELARHATRKALVVIFWQRQVEFELGAVKRLLQSNMDCNLVVIAGDGSFGAPSFASVAARQASKQIGQVDVFERRRSGVGKLLPPIRRWTEFLARLKAAELVEGRAFFRILECFVGFGDLLELLFGVGFLRDVRVILARELAVRLFDLLDVGAPVDA